LEGLDELLKAPPVRFSTPSDPDTPIAVGRLSTASGASTTLFSSPMSCASIGTGGGLNQLSKLACCILSRCLKIIVVVRY
jgi:hypothetical protein